MDFDSNSTQLPESFPEIDLATASLQWASIATASFGLAGNFLAYLTSARLKIQTSGTAFMKCLAVADSSTVVIVNSQSMVSHLLSSNSVMKIDYICKTGRFLSAIAAHLGAYSKNLDRLVIFKSLLQ